MFPHCSRRFDAPVSPFPCLTHFQIPIFDYFSSAYHFCHIDHELLQSSLSLAVPAVDVGPRGFVYAFLRGVDAVCGKNCGFDSVFAGFEVCGVSSRANRWGWNIVITMLNCNFGNEREDSNGEEG